MKKGTFNYNRIGEMALEILDKIISELGVTNVKCFGFYKNKWIVKYKKGKQDKFDSFDDMYIFLRDEGK